MKNKMKLYVMNNGIIERTVGRRINMDSLACIGCVSSLIYIMYQVYNWFMYM